MSQVGGVAILDSPSCRKNLRPDNPATPQPPYLSLLLLPGWVKQQVAVPVLLLRHVVLSRHVRVVVLDVRFYLHRHVSCPSGVPFPQCLPCAPLATQSCFAPPHTLSPLLLCLLPLSSSWRSRSPGPPRLCACLLCSCTCQNRPT